MINGETMIKIIIDDDKYKSEQLFNIDKIKKICLVVNGNELINIDIDKENNSTSKDLDELFEDDDFWN